MTKRTASRILSRCFPALCTLTSVLCAASVVTHWLPLFIAGLAMAALAIVALIDPAKLDAMIAAGRQWYRDSHMSRADREAWFEPTTLGELGELGELTAQWLEGARASQPGYRANCGPAPETAELVSTLAAANRAGFVTDGSQPGKSEEDEYGPWSQRAAVDGFCDDAMLDRIVAAVAEFGHGELLLIAHVGGAPRWRHDHSRSEPVTVSGRPDPCLDCGGPADLTGCHVHTGFGGAMSRHHIRTLGFRESNDDMLRVLTEANQVTLIDLEWGRVDSPLWPLLDRVARQTTTKEVA